MKKYQIGLLVDFVTSEYVQGLKESIVQFCATHNMQLYVFPVRSIIKPIGKYDYQYFAVFSHITEKKLDGLIIASGTQSNDMTKSQFLTLVKSLTPLPIVSMGYDLPNTPSIVSDCRKGFGDLIAHLIEKHHCARIALLSVDGHSVEVKERTEAYKKELEKHSIPIDESLIIKSRFDYTSAHDSMVQYVEKYGAINFDAVVALNEDMAYGCIDFCRENNLLVPDDIIVTGFDDLPRASFSTPTLTTVHQGLDEQGYIAAQTLYNSINKKDVPHIQKVESRALFRQSCGCITIDNRITCAIDSNNKTIPFESLHNTQSIAEWFIKREQILKVTQFITDAQDEIDLNTLRTKLNDSLSSFEILYAAICLYSTPVETAQFKYFNLPDKAYVLCAFDEYTGIHYYGSDENQIFFNPNKYITPPELSSVLKKEKIVLPLFHCKVQYGYIVYSPGKYDITIYEIMCRTLSSLISAAHVHTKSESEKRELAETNEKLDYISRTDELTRILNRRGFLQLGQHAINTALSLQQSGLIVYGDMDGLKKINDTYGHETGDRAIQTEALLLKASFRSSDIVGRLGGDEFAVVAVGLTEKEFFRIRKKLSEKCSCWNKRTSEKYCLTISLGCAGFDSESSDLVRLLKEADRLQYEEKRKKKVERR
jgi:diguanylate cyclase (GGDEF)-like protein